MERAGMQSVQYTAPRKDFIAFSVQGKVLTEPEKKIFGGQVKNEYLTFELENKRGNQNSYFTILSKEDMDVHKGDQLTLFMGKFFARGGKNYIVIPEGVTREVKRGPIQENRMDLSSCFVYGRICSEPGVIRFGSKDYFSFYLENIQPKNVTTFKVLIEASKCLDYLKGDDVVLFGAGFFERNGEIYLAITSKNRGDIGLAHQGQDSVIVTTEKFFA